MIPLLYGANVSMEHRRSRGRALFPSSLAYGSVMTLPRLQAFPPSPCFFSCFPFPCVVCLWVWWSSLYLTCYTQLLPLNASASAPTPHYPIRPSVIKTPVLTHCRIIQSTFVVLRQDLLVFLFPPCEMHLTNWSLLRSRIIPCLPASCSSQAQQPPSMDSPPFLSSHSSSSKTLSVLPQFIFTINPVQLAHQSLCSAFGYTLWLSQAHSRMWIVL